MDNITRWRRNRDGRDMIGMTITRNGISNTFIVIPVQDIPSDLHHTRRKHARWRFSTRTRTSWLSSAVGSRGLHGSYVYATHNTAFSYFTSMILGRKEIAPSNRFVMIPLSRQLLDALALSLEMSLGSTKDDIPRALIMYI
jgi:hypothetical protein